MDAPAESGGTWQLLIAALIVLLVLLHYLLWLAEDGVRQTQALRISIQAQTEENAAMNERNRALEADVIDLKNGLMAIEERARSEVGMIRADETFYRILDQPLPQPTVEIAPAKPAASIRKASPSVKPLPSTKPATSAKPPTAAKPPTSAKPPNSTPPR